MRSPRIPICGQSATHSSPCVTACSLRRGRRSKDFALRRRIPSHSSSAPASSRLTRGSSLESRSTQGALRAKSQSAGISLARRSRVARRPISTDSLCWRKASRISVTITHDSSLSSRNARRCGDARTRSAARPRSTAAWCWRRSPGRSRWRRASRSCRSRRAAATCRAARGPTSGSSTSTSTPPT